MSTTNPLSLLGEITLETISMMDSSGYTFGVALCTVLRQREGVSHQRCTGPGRMASLASFLQLAESAKKFIDRNARERSKEALIEKVNSLTHLLVQYLSIQKSNANEKGEIMRHAKGIQEAGDLLAPFDDQSVATKEEVQELCRMIDDLMEFVIQSQMADSMKSRLIRSLGFLRTSVQRSLFTSMDDIIADMDAVLGAGVRALGTAQTPAEKKDAEDFLAKAAKASESIGKVMEFGQKYLLPLAPAGQAAIKAITGS